MQDGDASVAASLRASRARLLTRADAERREIERSLHDGIQQDLVALAVRLELARRLADSEPVAAQTLLDEIRADVHEALEGVRALSERIYPSLLATRGLAEALRGLAAATGSSIRVEAETLGRYPPELEGAVYFCCREALESAAARGARATLRIWQEADTLRFEVADDGESSDLAGSDLRHVRDRIDTLGGRLTILSEPAGGRRVSAAIPLS
jgi:signal transduction histidine kinase